MPLRPLSFQRKYVKHPAGSCLVSFGETRVLCTVSIEKEVPPFRRGSGGGWLTAPSLARTTTRNWGSVREAGPNVGFRCARDD